MKILYEDKDLILCEKPVGVSSQQGDGKAPDMLTLLADYRRGQGSDDYVGLVHRLDTPTGGVMLYSKRADMTGKLSELVANGDYQKTYLAVVHGAPEAPAGELCDLLFHDKRKNKSYVTDKKRQGVKEALATYRLLETVEKSDGGKMSLVEVTLITGRTHQIRVQFASRKMPLVGDGKYGSKDNKATCALWSHKVSFTHPVTGKQVTAESQPGKGYPWGLFQGIEFE